ncbi:MAG: DUF934 domain-containing protein [Georgfuchsia sp.]
MADIIKDREIIADDWIVIRLAEGETATAIALPEGKLIVPLAVWQLRRDELSKRGTLGIWLSDSEGPELIADDLEYFEVVAIDFPKFSNGRGYSSASLLRTRYSYRGELRAIGDVLRDQMFYLLRVGFNAIALRPDRSIQDALNALNDFSVTYQTSTDETQPLFRRVNRVVTSREPK